MLSPSYLSLISFVSSITVIEIVIEVLDHLGWQQAMIFEMQALEHNST